MRSEVPLGIKFPRYTATRELWVIATYFNPCRYQSRRNNYDIFALSLQSSGIPLLTIECAFGDDEFTLPDSLDIVKVRSHSLLWQKERLLNLAASWLPRHVKYIAWIDCDVLFMNPNWAIDTVTRLKEYPVVQLFEGCTRLEKGNVLTKSPDRTVSFGQITPTRQDTLEKDHFELHGHTGYAWAMRREIFDEVGLYEHAIAGTGDHFMAHAVWNSYGFCIEQGFSRDVAQIDHFREWSKRFYRMVRGRLGVTPGEIMHLWHGDLTNRRYILRMEEITKRGYNPYTDIVARTGKPLEWQPELDKPALRDYFAEYFTSRREDG